MVYPSLLWALCPCAKQRENSLSHADLFGVRITNSEEILWGCLLMDLGPHYWSSLGGPREEIWSISWFWPFDLDNLLLIKINCDTKFLWTRKKIITPISLIFLCTKKKPNYLQILGFLEERATVLVLYIIFYTNWSHFLFFSVSVPEYKKCEETKKKKLVTSEMWNASPMTSCHGFLFLLGFFFPDFGNVKCYAHSI